MKKLFLPLIAFSLFSCTPEALPQQQKEVKSYASNQEREYTNTKPVTFTVVWNSNQEGATCRFTKYEFRDCQIISSIVETHQENSFEITLDPAQRFEVAILKESQVKNPKLSLSFYKEGKKIYSEVFLSGSVYFVGQVHNDGNIGNNY